MQQNFVTVLSIKQMLFIDNLCIVQ